MDRKDQAQHNIAERVRGSRWALARELDSRLAREPELDSKPAVGPGTELVLVRNMRWLHRHSLRKDLRTDRLKPFDKQKG